MATSISDKLKIKEKFCLLTLNAPENLKKVLQGLQSGVKITDAGNDPIAIGYNQVHWFVMKKAQMKRK